ncbi:MAG: ABC transporter ATP-binding protein [Eubacterium sp.]|nr:ABC transporter ATP-binding protein [Eubacterium sp.]
MIQVENLVKKYGVHTAVDDLSFTVEKGQIYGFLGPNGAGKSTTMNIMTGYIAASSGTVTINGYDILKEPEKAKKCIGYLPEMPPLYMDMTVWEYLMFVSELKKVPKNDRSRHVEEIIEKLQLTEVRDRLIRNISKGYKQRVGLAQALIGDPDVLILDEPMVGLDPKQIIEMRDLIKSLSKEHTVILSSHILSEVSAVCDHIMIISKGRLVASGSPEELQEMMHVKVELELTILGTREQAENVLQEIEQIESYEIEEAEETGAVHVRIDVTDNADIRKELSLALSGAGLPILSMNRMEKSLEDIFLELTDTKEDGENAESEEKEDLEEDNNLEEDDNLEVEDDADMEDAIDREKEGPDDDSDL